MSTSKKLPKLFRKPLSSTQLQKKVLKKIYVKSEREFLNSKLERNQAGNYFLDPDKFDKAELKRLRSLAKSIKKNKGVLVGWKAGLLLLILLVILGFNLFLKDRIFEKTAERYLEQVFKAEVDLQEPQIKLFSGSVSFERLIIADAQQPLRNLAEIGASRLSIDTGRLLARKFIINELTCSEIRFHTERRRSGALESTEPEKKQPAASQAGNSGGLAEMGALGLQIGSESAQSLVESYKSSLQSPELIESVNQRYRESRQRWEARSATVDNRIQSVRTRSENVLGTDIDSIDSVSKARSYLEELQGLKVSVRSARREAEAAYEEFEHDTEYISRSRESIETAIDSDVEFLEEAVGSFTSDSLKVVTETAKPILRARFGSLFDYGERISRTHRQLKATSTQKKSKFEDGRRRGTLVHFPMREYPGFLLEHFEVSTGAAHDTGFSEFIVQNITGEQEVVGKPTSVSFSTAAEVQRVTSDLLIDSRADSEYLLQGTTDLELFPVEIAEGMGSISTESLKAQSDTELQVFIKPDLSGKGQANVSLYDMSFSFQNPSSEFERAVQDILGGVKSTDLNIDFEFSDGNISAISVESELDSLLSERISDYTRQRADEAAAQMETALYEYVDEELNSNEALSEDLRGLGRELRNDIQSAENLEQLLEQEQQRVEAEIRKIQNKVKDRAGDALQDLGGDLDLPGF